MTIRELKVMGWDEIGHADATADWTPSANGHSAPDGGGGLASWAGREPSAVIAEAYERYAASVRDFVAVRTGSLSLAEDVTQDVFVLALKAWDHLRDPGQLRGWLYGTARNLAREEAKRRRRRGDATDIDAEGDLADPHRGPEDVVIADELGQLVWEAAAALEERQRDALILAYREQLTTAEIGQVLGVTARHAAAIVPKARTALGAAVAARLVLRERHRCPTLAVALAGANGRFTAAELRTVQRHARDCATCKATRTRLTRPWELFGALLVFPAGSTPAPFDPGRQPPALAPRAAHGLGARLRQPLTSPLRSLVTTPLAIGAIAGAVALGTAGGMVALRRGDAAPVTRAAVAGESLAPASAPSDAAPAAGGQTSTAAIGATSTPAATPTATAPADESTKGTSDIWNDTLNDVRASQSYHITYSTTAFDFDATQFDIQFTRLGDFAGTITLATSPSDSLEVRKVAGVMYVHAPSVVREPDIFGLTGGQAAQLGTGWLILGITGPQSDVVTLVDRAVAPFADPSSLADGILSPDPGATTAGVDAINGVRVIVLRDPNGVLDVTDTAQPYPVRVTGDYDRLDLGEFNAVPAIGAPADAQRISSG